MIQNMIIGPVSGEAESHEGKQVYKVAEAVAKKGSSSSDLNNIRPGTVLTYSSTAVVDTSGKITLGPGRGTITLPADRTYDTSENSLLSDKYFEINGNFYGQILSFSYSGTSKAHFARYWPQVIDYRAVKYGVTDDANKYAKAVRGSDGYWRINMTI